MTETDRREAGELISELREKEQSLTCGEEAAERYRSIHERRFSKTFSLCVELAPDPQIRVLDIGPSHLTHLLAGRYKNITALGFAPSSDRGGHVDKPVAAPGIRQIVFDLNLSQFPDRWPATDRLFDLIVYAETIEHLQIPPEYSLLFLGSLLAENGLLLVTTPNAASIMKRLILMLKGRNPFDKIRFFKENPGHYREYTAGELVSAGANCGLEAVEVRFINFYRAKNFIQAFLKSLKPAFRDSIIVIFKRTTQQ